MTLNDRYDVRALAAPWYADNPSFLRAPWVTPESVPAGDIAVVGMPIDAYATTMGHTGMRLAPRRIREASLHTSRYFGIQSDSGLGDFATGVIRAWPDRLPLVDAGDVPVVPHDTTIQVAVASDYVATVTRNSSLTVTLGGDHFVAFPSVKGVLAGLRDRSEHSRLGYLHIDSHTDFVDAHHLTGKFSHGTAARRISELPGIKKMAWFGVNANTQVNQVQVMYDRGFRVATAHYIDDVGPGRAMERVLEYLLEDVDVLYVSIDIDVVNASDAPATSAATFRGISAPMLLDALTMLSRVDTLVGFDICEVNPTLDGSTRTEMLAAKAVMEILATRLFPMVAQIPAEQLAQIVLTTD